MVSVMTTRFVLPGVEVELLGSQVRWIVRELRDWHANDLAAQTMADTLEAVRVVELRAVAEAEARALLAVVESDRVRLQPQPQEAWRLQRLTPMLASRLSADAA